MAQDSTWPAAKKSVCQIGLVVSDIQKASKAWAELFGVEVPQYILTESSEKAHTRYKGKPTDGRAKIALFQLDNLWLELIEPVSGPSTWQEFLDTNGPGIHHIAFEVKNMDKQIAVLESKGLPLLQRGRFPGGCYAYLDTAEGLGTFLELLENY